jgi:hypothetical protein
VNDSRSPSRPPAKMAGMNTDEQQDQRRTPRWVQWLAIAIAALIFAAGAAVSTGILH